MSNLNIYTGSDGFSADFQLKINTSLNSVLNSKSFIGLSNRPGNANLTEVIISSNLEGFSDFINRPGVDAQLVTEFVKNVTGKNLSGSTLRFENSDGTAGHLIYISEDKSSAYKTIDGLDRQISLDEVLYHELAHAYTPGKDSELNAATLTNEFRDEKGIEQRSLAPAFGSTDPAATPLNNTEPKTLDEIEREREEYFERNRCFAAGTLIDMADGTQKPIETVEIGDEVLAYDPDAEGGLGSLKPARVARTMTNFVDEVIDFHGVKVTPGHATLCAEGPNKGQHIPLMDIIREDGVIADRDGTLIRAATNLPVGSAGDQKVQVAYILNKSQQTYFKGKMRLGTLMVGGGDKADWRIMDALQAEGYQVFEDGLIAKDGETPHPLYWYGEVPKPEDYILKKSALTLADLYAGNGTLKSGAPAHAGMTVQ